MYRAYTKYKNRKVKTEEGTFDSVREFRRWLYLKEQQANGEIFNLQRQVNFELIPAQREPDTRGKRGGLIRGKTIERSVDYNADFVYQLPNGETVVEDSKGDRTKDYIIKRKLMLYVHGIQIKEV